MDDNMLEQDILEFYAEHKNLAKTRKQFGIGDYSLKKLLRNNGYTRENFRAKNWDRNDDQKVVDLYESGVAADEIGKEFGYCHTTILRVLKRLGVIRRKTSSVIYKGIPEPHLYRIKAQAQRRFMDFEVSEEYLLEVFDLQKKKCKLSGVDIRFADNYSEWIQGESTTSLDRIDSTKGYIEGNVQWLHKSVNIMKQSMTDQEFISWCNLITNNNNKEQV